jgi:hypothetical protein
VLPKPGQPVALTVDASRLLFFDPESLVRLVSSNTAGFDVTEGG